MLLQLQLMVTSGSLTTPRVAPMGHHSPTWAWLAEISKTALYKIKGNSSCCASQHSLEQPGAGAACGMSDLSYPEHPCWGSTPGVFTGESHQPLQESGAQEQSEHWDCTGKGQGWLRRLQQGLSAHPTGSSISRGSAAAQGARALQELSWEVNV